MEPGFSNVETAFACVARVHERGMQVLRGGAVTELLGEALEAILVLTGADFGTVHTLDPETNQLRFAVDRMRLSGSDGAHPPFEGCVPSRSARSMVLVSPPASRSRHRHTTRRPTPKYV